MGNIAVVDLSWIMHRYRYAYEDFSCIIDNKRRPTGHIYGTYHFVKDLSQRYKKVLLAVDSNPTLRKEVYPQYKSNRHKEVVDEFKDYDIHKDLNDILSICNFQNVYYIKEEGYEADDIIGTLIKQSNLNWDFYFRDNDILQNIGFYNLCVSFGSDMSIGYPTDIKAHIQKKYELDLDYLPLLWKIIKGDSGDCIPIGIKQFPTKILKELCYDKRFCNNDVTFEDCVNVLLEYKNYTGKTKENIEQLKDKESELYKKLSINYKLVKPMYLNVIERKKMNCDNPQAIFSKFQIRDI